MPLGPGTRLGPYEILSALGAGGMGEVYRARDTKLDRDVAIKVLPEAFAADPERIARFQREAKTLASLNHPHIATIHGIEESGGTHALVMELVEGEDLSQRIARGPIPIDEALPIAKQIAEALEAAHEQGIIHRDLKPANIKVTPDGNVKVLDFGLAKLAAASTATAASPGALSLSPTITSPALMTGVGVLLGTAAYMSPEQAKGREADRRSDIWAFGAVLYEMLSGKRAFAGDDVSDTLIAVLRDDPDWSALPAETPARVRQAMRVCLQRNPKQRAQAIGDVRLALEGAFETATSPPPPQASSPSARGRLVWVAAFAIAAVSAAALSVPAVRYLRETPPVQQNYRFQVTPPPGTRFTTFRLSPDGRSIAYIAVGGQTTGSGQGGLWIRPLDSLELRQVPGSEGASYPFWSPDSAFVGFFQAGKLKKVSATGGPAQTICDVADSRGGTWGPDGTILFTDGPAKPIFRVPSAGGKPVQVTKLTGGDPGEGHRSPEFLPDGQHFVFDATANNPDKAGIEIGSLDGSTPMRLLPDDANGIYAPGEGSAGEGAAGGHLFFLRDGTLMALPLDPTLWKATGEAFPVAENVAIAANNRYGAFSLAAHGTLAYWGGGEVNNRELVWMDRSGKRLNTLGKPGPFGPYALSPDEKTVAATLGSFPQTDIWLLDVASGSSTRFSFGFTGLDPAWFPDGRSIVYTHRNASTANDIVRRQLTGGAEERLLANIVNPEPRDVSSDGALIVHSMSVAATAFDIGLLSAGGDHRESPYLNSPANEREARMSPDRKWMAYESDESGQFQVYVQTIPAGEAKFQISTSGGVMPIWRHDGGELYYLDPNQKIMAVPVKISGASFQSGTPQALFTAVGASYVVTHDGQRFLVNVPAGGDAAAGPPLTIVTDWRTGLKK